MIPYTWWFTATSSTPSAYIRWISTFQSDSDEGYFTWKIGENMDPPSPKVCSSSSKIINMFILTFLYGGVIVWGTELPLRSAVVLLSLCCVFPYQSNIPLRSICLHLIVKTSIRIAHHQHSTYQIKFTICIQEICQEKDVWQALTSAKTLDWHLAFGILLVPLLLLQPLPPGPSSGLGGKRRRRGDWQLQPDIDLDQQADSGVWGSNEKPAEQMQVPSICQTRTTSSQSWSSVPRYNDYRRIDSDTYCSICPSSLYIFCWIYIWIPRSEWFAPFGFRDSLILKVKVAAACRSQLSFGLYVNVGELKASGIKITCSPRLRSLCKYLEPVFIHHIQLISQENGSERTNVSSSTFT